MCQTFVISLLHDFLKALTNIPFQTMALFHINSKVVRLSTSQLRCYSSCLKMKKGLVLGVYEGEKSDVVLTPSAAKYNELVNGKLLVNISLAGPTIKKSKTRVFWGLEDGVHACVAVVGLGKQNLGYNSLEEIDEGKENIRVAVAAGCSALDAVDVKDIEVEPMGNAEAAAEGAILSTWVFQEFKNKAKKKKLPNVSLYGTEEQDSWNLGKIKADAQNWVRLLEDTPANLMTPTIFGETVSQVLTAQGIDVIVHDELWATKKKMGSFLSVSRGSAEPPKFVEIHYKGAESTKAPIAFVGKGVTFDAGGISLKSAGSMDEMRSDMGGAACVAGLIKAASDLKLKVNLIGLIPLTENLPSGTATKPGDIVTAMNGKTIIIDNTDGEGRLILADALTYASEFNPEFIVDIATLTGAIRMALGNAATGVFSSSNELWEVLRQSGSITGDRMWRMPLWQHFNNQMTKPYKAADLNNCARAKGGGSCTAAGFLREFASADVPWLHLDMAGVMGPTNDEISYLASGMSGRPVRTLIQFIQNIADGKAGCKR
ncbi:cytosol aminopeptidase-like isoform X2 [Diachasmimorpha longicaudata]|uniref:cytosol aminopeptidase-like isoform X2 n=1 Tax=Diachasmimorpha longicaudata TaxID=58733 RepID=UPI0030B87900